MNSKYSAIVIRYHALPQKTNYSMLRYIWLDGNGRDLRTKSNYMKSEPKSVEEVPHWCYCGQTCGHMKLTENSDCWLKPVLLCKDPFRQHTNKLVFCVPIKYEIPGTIVNHFLRTGKIQKYPHLLYDRSIKSYILLNPLTKKPIGWPFEDYDSVKHSSNCGVGTNIAVGRDISEAFDKACLYAGLHISASQTEDMPAMCSFELGPTRGISVADELWMARFILNYIGEEFNCVISFDPLKHDSSIHPSMDVWVEGGSPFMSFPVNSDPYVAIKTISELI